MRFIKIYTRKDLNTELRNSNEKQLNIFTEVHINRQIVVPLSNLLRWSIREWLYCNLKDQYGGK